ncbi:MAG: alpha-mannosidase, partial [Chloroflexi bacterium]|nr:alpha-mannosidase [Chloroflexota bacterium]
VALGISQHLNENNPARHHLLTALDEAFKNLDIRTPIGNAFYESVPQAHAILREGIERSGPPLDVDITAIGHAHIDVAWLWTLGQTRQKAARTFHNVLRLMEDFPEFRFAQSQPQLYEYIRGDYPELFAAIKERIIEGRWEPLGGMWVEADCNLSGPESLARQFLLGRNFFREHFSEGVDSPVLWLPDVFGYAWNLPQLIKEAGLEYFFTIKIGWSQYNRFPYDSFWWQGLDGTKVLTHFSPTKNPDSPHASTYNSDASPAQTLRTWFNFQGKDHGPPGVTPPLLISYGWGDGGGGPTREMLENIREMGHFPATPQIHTGKVGEFFRKLETEIGDRLPTWNGELYLEYHRGTYTTQARVKRANRKSEFLLHDAEFLATYASILDPNYQYPFDQFTKAWQLVCLNQFHDIIPGSSIAPVYAETLEQHAEVHQIAAAARDEALAVIAAKMGAEIVVVNPTSFARNEIVEIDGKTVDIGELPPYSVKAKSNVIANPERFFGVKQSPSDDEETASPQNDAPRSDIFDIANSNLQPSTFNISPELLENNFLRFELNEAGDITRIFDKIAAREVLPPGAIANQFQAFEDMPLSWDAWDIDIFYDDKMWLAEPATSVKVVEAGPLRVTLEINRRILNSGYTQRISLTHNSPRLDFDTHINWQERQILLKVAFPVDVLTPTATYEIQWGNVERPTHRNTSWDWARFETCAQKWVDLSEGGYGVSLLNDCKYGHDIRDHIMRLTLLRGTTAPDPGADLGEHNFKYSLLPHQGSWGVDTVREAYALNDPVIVYQPTADSRPPTAKDKQPSAVNPQSPISSLQSLISTNRPNIVIETIKRAEDGHGIIVRMYESQRKRGPFTLTTNFLIAEAWRTNILEENQEEIPVKGTELQYTIKPYQILTLRLTTDRYTKHDQKITT